MNFYTKIILQMTDKIGEYIVIREGEFQSDVWDKLCGASQQQKDLEQQQANFYAEQTAEYQTVFNENQAILQNLTAEFTPILQAGPNQQGFSAAQLENLNSTAVTGTGQAYNAAEKAVAANEAAQGGGNDFLPSGAKTQLNEEIASSAAQQVGNEESQIEQANYATGLQNFDTAAQVLGGTAAQLNPATFSDAATSAGNAAASTANAITQANNSWMGLLGGALGSAATAYAGYAQGGH